MTVREKRLKVVQSHNQKQADKAAQQLAASRSQAERQQQALEQIMNYQREYAESFMAKAQAGISVQALKNYQFFLAKIGSAVTHQHKVLEQAEANTQKSMNNWQQKYRMKKAMDTVVDKAHQQTVKLQESQEQKEMDEYGARLAAVGP